MGSVVLSFFVLVPDPVCCVLMLVWSRLEVTTKGRWHKIVSKQNQAGQEVPHCEVPWTGEVPHNLRSRSQGVLYFHVAPDQTSGGWLRLHKFHLEVPFDFILPSKTNNYSAACLDHWVLIYDCDLQVTLILSCQYIAISSYFGQCHYIKLMVVSVGLDAICLWSSKILDLHHYRSASLL